MYKALLFASIFTISSCNNSTNTLHNKNDSATQITNKKDSTGSTLTKGVTVQNNGQDFNRLIFDEKDSTMWLTADIKLDHRIFGYERPDTTSGKLILLSVFTRMYRVTLSGAGMVLTMKALVWIVSH